MGHHRIIKLLLQIQRTDKLFVEVFPETSIEITPLDLVIEAECVTLDSRFIHLRGGAECLLDKSNLVKIMVFDTLRDCRSLFILIRIGEIDLLRCFDTAVADTLGTDSPNLGGDAKGHIIAKEGKVVIIGNLTDFGIIDPFRL